jgi:hypothetical protein
MIRTWEIVLGIQEWPAPAGLNFLDLDAVDAEELVPARGGGWYA